MRLFSVRSLCALCVKCFLLCRPNARRQVQWRRLQPVGFGPSTIDFACHQTPQAEACATGAAICKLASIVFSDQAQLAVLSIERESPQLGRLRRELR